MLFVFFRASRRWRVWRAAVPFVICAELRVTAQRERQSSDLAYAWGALRRVDEPVGCHARLQRLRITIESIASVLQAASSVWPWALEV